MDMTYLLWLQDFRASINDALTPFLEELSLFALTWLVFVPVFVYWCVNKRDGLFLFVSMGISWFFNGVVKLTVCAYRPWIRDPRIVPAGNAINTAGGYSFPSGHTMWSSPVYGGVAVLARKRAAWLSCLCVILIVLTAFSRNYLGVHTPQDVIVGTTLGLFAVWIASKIFARPEKENLILLTGLILCVLDVVYVMNKSYPMDYVDGKLLVDPVKMMNDTFHGIGMLAGLIIGRWIEREYIDFKATGFSAKGIILTLIGFVPYYCIVFNFTKKYTWLLGPLTAMLTARWGYMVLGFMTSFYAICVWPYFLKKFNG